ncbi:MAG: COX15/CtaA family protein [Verrucomicrobia bacterium]|nr:COX15/CtaA family protein [Verrucomicrobiota bacterium]
MTWTRFQRLALIAFIAVELLIFMGAIVRATGSGLGCPDWPFCYGCWLPPAKAQDIDFTKLNLEKFRAKAERLGRDPSTITVESLRAEFDPVATWVEYINRLSTVPVGISVLILCICSFGQIKAGRASVTLTALSALFLVLLNAWLGARVVISGLKPGIITLHMALAILLQCVLVFAAWRGTDQPWRIALNDRGAGRIRLIAWAIFLLVILEGIMGSQVRELTDQLARLHAHQARSVWTFELEHSLVYLVHRSFSWVIFGASIWFAAVIRKAAGRLSWLEVVIVALVFLQMLLGVVLSQIGIVRVAQILHIGASSLLVSAIFLWLLAAQREVSASTSGATPAFS